MHLSFSAFRSYFVISLGDPTWKFILSPLPMYLLSTVSRSDADALPLLSSLPQYVIHARWEDSCSSSALSITWLLFHNFSK